VWALEPDPASDRLGDLLRYGMIEFNKGFKRYHLHDLARDFARSLQGDTDRGQAGLRHARHYKNVLTAADDLYRKRGDNVLRGLALFDLEQANILAGHAWAEAHAGQGAAAGRLTSRYPNAGANVLKLRQRPRERIAWREAALATARRLQDRWAEAVHLGNLGAIYLNLGEARRAIEYYEQSLLICREIRYRRVVGQHLGNLGNAYRRLGELRRAIEYYEQQLAMSREKRNRDLERAALNNLGRAYAALGEQRRAIELYEQALVIDREIGDRRGEGQDLGYLGVAYKRLGDLGQTINYYEQQLAISREIGDREGESRANWNLGRVYEQQGDLSKAIAAMQFLVDFEREIVQSDAEPYAAHVEAMRARLSGG
jgi:tetratricopeptide (TPR) repeat protein